MFGLSYEVIKACQTKGMRNGNWRFLNTVQRGFYRACLAYARVRRVIVNPNVVRLLGALMCRLRSMMRVRALRSGMEEAERVTPIYLKIGVFKWAFKLMDWLMDESYLFWLGITRLNSLDRQRS